MPHQESQILQQFTRRGLGTQGLGEQEIGRINLRSLLQSLGESRSRQRAGGRQQTQQFARGLFPTAVSERERRATRAGEQLTRLRADLQLKVLQAEIAAAGGVGELAARRLLGGTGGSGGGGTGGNTLQQAQRLVQSAAGRGLTSSEQERFQPVSRVSPQQQALGVLQTESRTLRASGRLGLGEAALSPVQRQRVEQAARTLGITRFTGRGPTAPPGGRGQIGGEESILQQLRRQLGLFGG